jgi:hypothetical protein
MNGARMLGVGLLALVFLGLHCWFVGGDRTGGEGAIAGSAEDQAGEEPRAALQQAGAAEREPLPEPVGQTPPEPASAAEQEQRGVGIVHGRVVDRAGAPFHPSAIRVVSAGAVSDPLSTDLGRFSLELPPGVHRIELDSELLPAGFLAPWSQGRDTHAPHDAEPNGFYAKVVDVPEQGGEFEVVLRVFEEASAFGRVVDFRGSPVVGVTVRLQSAGPLAGLHADTRTDAAGRFELRPLHPGRYRTQAWLGEAADPAQRGLCHPTPVDVEVLEASRVEIPTLVAGAGTKTVRGVVLDQDGAPFPGLMVRCYLASEVAADALPHDWSSHLMNAETDARGEFELAGLPSELVRLQIPGDWEPRSEVGKRKAAFFLPPMDVDLRGALQEYRLPSVTLDASRPFTFRGRVVLDPAFAARHEIDLGSLRVHVALRDPQAQPDPAAPRRPSFEERPKIDAETGELLWMCETPLAPVSLTLSCKRGGARPVTLELEPKPLAVVERTLRFP